MLMEFLKNLIPSKIKKFDSIGNLKNSIISEGLNFFFSHRNFIKFNPLENLIFKNF